MKLKCLIRKHTWLSAGWGYHKNNLILYYSCAHCKAKTNLTYDVDNYFKTYYYGDEEYPYP